MMNNSSLRTVPVGKAVHFIRTRLAKAFAMAVLGLSALGALAQNQGDYRSRQSGDWDAPGTWEQWTGSQWIYQNEHFSPGSVIADAPTFPVVAGTSTSAKTNTDNLPHVITLPNGIEVGDLLLIFWADASNSNTNPTLSGWTQLATSNSNTNTVYRKIWYRIADGTEGNSVSTNSFGDRSAHVVYRIAKGTYTGTPVVSGADNGTDSSPNAPNLAPGIGSQKFLWIASAHAAEVQSFSTPTNFSNDLAIGSTTSSTNSNQCQVITARRNFEAASLDVGAFSLGGSATHTAWTVAIRGGTAPQSFPNPVITATAQGVQSGSDVSSHSITIPSGDAGDLLVAVFSVDQNPTVTTSSTGWTKLGQATNTGTGGNANQVTGAIFWKLASGTTPAADALSLTTSNNQRSSHITYRIKGATGISGSSSGGSGTNSDPPSHTPAGASWLWMATRSGDGTTVATSAPTNYGDMITQAAGHNDGASTNTATRLFGSAQNSAQNPGTFTSGNEQWVSWTLAIQGPAQVVSYTPIDVPEMTGTGGDGYPAVAATATSAKTVTSGTTHTVSLPSEIQSGDLLLIFWADANTSGTQPSTPSGWTTLYSGRWGTADVYYRAWYRIANGSEGSTVNVTAGAERSAHTAYRIAAGSYQGLPVASTGTTGTTSSNPDPPNLTSGFGNVATLWIAAAHITGTIWATPPANFSNLINGNSGAAGVDHAFMATAERKFTAASQNPGTFTIDTDHSWGAYTVAVRGVPPIPGTPATILTGHTVTVHNDASIDNLTIESGGTLDLASDNLTVNGGSLVVNGSITGTAGGLVLGSQANSAMNVTGTGSIDVYDMTANTSGGVTMNPNLGVRGTLQLNSGTFTANGSVTLLSDADGTGRLGPVGATANYAGNLKVERYIPAGLTNWRMLGSPVAGQTVQNWKDDFYTAGFPGSHYPSFDSPWMSGNLWPSIRWYDETVASADPDDGITGVSSNTQPLTPGQGFLAWCGDNLTTTTAFTVDVTGAPTIAKTPLALPMTRTNTGNAAADGWNLVSNPLPSPIDFTQISRGANVQNAYWIFDPVAGTHRAWSAGAGQGTVNGIIQSSQGFWLKANGNAITTTVNEAAKVNAPTGGTFGGQQQPTLPILGLVVSSNVNTYSDEATLVFANGTPEYGGDDALKFNFHTNGAPQIGILSTDGHELAIDFYGAYSEMIAIPLHVAVDANGTYTITASATGINNLSCLTLVDTETGAVTPLLDGTTYSFQMTVDAENTDTRFVINGTKPLALSVNNALCHGEEGSAGIISNEGPINLVWTDAFGNPLLTQSVDNSSNDYFEFNTAPGKYMVYASPAGACGEVSATFTITEPEEMEAGTDVLDASCTNVADGHVEVSVTGGTAPYTYAWSNGDGEASVEVAAGNYTVIVTDANGCTLPLEVAVAAEESPEALFALDSPVVVAGVAVAFVNQSANAEAYLWNFGDGNTSTEEAPEHTWAIPGDYTVTLTATAGACEAIFTMDVTVGINTAIATDDLEGRLRVWATPDHIVIEHPFGSAPVDVDVYDATGRRVMGQGSLKQPERILLNDQDLSDGVWLVRITNGEAQYTFRVPLVR